MADESALSPSPQGLYISGMLRILSALCFGLLVSSILGSQASAQVPRTPQSRADISLSFAPVVKRAAPAVVNVYAQRKVQGASNPFFDDPFFRRFFGGQMPGMGQPAERVQRSLGSGVIVDPSGIVVTNHHVIENADQIKVALADKREFEAEVLLRDQRSDLAILQIKDGRERFTSIEFGDSDAIEVGDLVLAIGDPFGVGQTVTQGIVSALARTQLGISDYSFFIQTDAAINMGNSGGALVDMAGKLVGINTALYSRTGGSVGIGFAIPVNMVRVVLDSARGGGKAVKRPWFGAKLQAVSPDIAESMGLKRPTGALVTSVIAGSPAAQAGIKIGDLIVMIDGQPVEDPNTFDYRFATKSLGATANLSVERQGKSTAVQIKLVSAPETPREEITIQTRSPFSGVKVVNLSPAVAEELRLDATTEGVVIIDVASGSLASNVGFKPGDIVVSVNGEAIAKSRDLDRVAKNQTRTWKIVIQRGGQQLTVVLNG
jgi:Do/DeqQ family serine protease